MEAEMLERLLELLNAKSDDDLAPNSYATLVREARAEALIEAKARLKEMFVQAILQTALGMPSASPVTDPPPNPSATLDTIAASSLASEAAAPAIPAAASEPVAAEATPATWPDSRGESVALVPGATPEGTTVADPAAATDATPAAGPAALADSGAIPADDFVATTPTPADAATVAPLTAAVAPVVAERSDGAHSAAIAPVEEMPDDRQRLLDEMAAIRRQIAENEARLRNPQTSPAAQDGSDVPSGDETAAGSAVEGASAIAEEASGPAVAAAGAPGNAYYVYGLLPVDAAIPSGVDAIPGIDPAFAVMALPHGEIQAAASKVPLCEYDEAELAARFEDLAWVEEKVRRHQEVQERLMAYGPLVPLRFCTLYRSPERVEALLAENYAHWAQLLQALRGKQEWGVKVYLDQAALVARVGEVSPKVQKLKAQIDQRSNGAAYFVKKQLEDAIGEEVERLGDEYAQDSHDRLTACAVAACLNSLQNAEFAGTDAKMLVNGAYLVDDARWAAFRAELAALEARYGPLGLTYVLTGPWPPYNFIPASEEEAHESSSS